MIGCGYMGCMVVYGCVGRVGGRVRIRLRVRVSGGCEVVAPPSFSGLSLGLDE